MMCTTTNEVVWELKKIKGGLDKYRDLWYFVIYKNRWLVDVSEPMPKAQCEREAIKASRSLI